jgi:hypothetical protein
MIGPRYWATGITVHHHNHPQRGATWSARVDFLDDGFLDDDPTQGRVSTQGHLGTRYALDNCGGDHTVALAAAIDAVKADAERLGIGWKYRGEMGPCIFIGDEESEDNPPGWRGLLNEQARRIGWEPFYTETTTR